MLIFILVLIQLSSVQLIASLNYSQQSVVLLLHDLRLARIERQLDSYGAWFAWQFSQSNMAPAPVHADYQVDTQWAEVDCVERENTCLVLNLNLRHTRMPLQRSARYSFQRSASNGSVAWQRHGE